MERHAVASGPDVGLSCGLLAAGATLLTFGILAAEHVPAHWAVVPVAAALAGVLVLACFGWHLHLHVAPWLLLAAALVGSRSLLLLSTGEQFGVRDAITHILGIPWAIVQTGHVPAGQAYSPYPLSHLLLAEAHLATGLDLWPVAGLLAPVISLGALLVVVAIARSAFPAAANLAAVAVVLASPFLGISQFYQPLEVSFLFMAGAVFLLVRDPPLRHRAWLLGVLFAAIVLTHPYSSFILLAVTLVSLPLGRFGPSKVYLFAALLGVCLFGLAYSVFAANNFVYFLRFLFPESSASAPAALFTAPTPLSVPLAYSATYRVVDGIAVVGTLLPAAVAWAVRLAKGDLRRPLQVLAVGFFLLFLAGYAEPFLLPARILALATVAVAPFAGLGLKGIPSGLRIAVVGIVCVATLTAPSVAAQFFPWTHNDPATPAVDNRADTGSTITFLAATGPPIQSVLASSHPLQYQNRSLLAYAFFPDISPSHPGANYLVFRTDTDDLGFGLAPYEGSPAIPGHPFTRYPSADQHRQMAAIDRIASIGRYRVYRL